MPVKHSVLVAIFVLGLVALFATRCAAQEQPMPDALPRRHSTNVATAAGDERVPDVGHSEARWESRDAAGDLALEIGGGLAGVGVVALPLVLALGCGAGDAVSGSATDCPVELGFAAAAIALPIIGIAVAHQGGQSGGNGTAWGALLGEAAGLGVFALTANADLGPIIIPWFAFTTVGGAVAGYRASADAEEDERIYATLAPTSNHRGGMFVIGGAL